MEYWSVGKMKSAVHPLLQYSSTPSLFEKTPEELKYFLVMGLYLFVRPYTKIPLAGWQIDIIGQKDPWRFDNGIE
jgi:hypothetical protein